MDEETLRRLYLHEKHSIREIAALVHVAPRSVYDALIRYNIPRRAVGSHTTHTQLDEATLRRLYLEEAQSIRTIAETAHLSPRAVYDLLIRYHIPRRRVGRQPALHSATSDDLGEVHRHDLRVMYEEGNHSIASIAAMLGCSQSRVRTMLVRWNITPRGRGRRANTNKH